MHVLVTGGTGTVGSQVVKELLARNVEVSILTREASKANALPPGIKAVVGDLGEAETVRRVFQNVDGVFLVTAVSPTEAHEGLMAVTGMRLASIKRVVYLSVQDADTAAWLPHFGAKVGVEGALKASGLPYTVLRPNNFHQNDYWFKDAILQYGVYPQPLGSAGVARVDIRDIAEAAANALTENGHEGQTYNLVGPDAHTGESTAQVWSRVLGKDVRYAGDDLDAWEKQFLQYLPEFMVFDFRQMYEFFQTHGFKGTPETLARQNRVLGHAPRSFDAFVEETAAAWKA
jgi:uncharacterized protein YbjT (DUF2867 family)